MLPSLRRLIEEIRFRLTANEVFSQPIATDDRPYAWVVAKDFVTGEAIKVPKPMVKPLATGPHEPVIVAFNGAFEGYFLPLRYLPDERDGNIRICHDLLAWYCYRFPERHDADDHIAAEMTRAEAEANNFTEWIPDLTLAGPVH